MSGMIVCLWAAAEHRIEAYVAALSALTYPRAGCHFRLDILRVGQGARDCTIVEAVSLAREIYGAEAAIEVRLGATLDSGRVIPVELKLWGEVFARTFDSYEPFLADVQESLSPAETEDLFGRLCASPH